MKTFVRRFAGMLQKYILNDQRDVLDKSPQENCHRGQCDIQNSFVLKARSFKLYCFIKSMEF